MIASSGARALRDFWFSGWRIDQLYDVFWVTPYKKVSYWMRNEPVDAIYNSIVAASQWAHHRLLVLQNGELRWYATTMVVGLILLLAVMLRNAP